jgi:hypothetical protein
VALAHQNPATTTVACAMGHRSPVSDLGRPFPAQMHNTFSYFSFELIQFIQNQIQISKFQRNLFIYK